MKLARLNVTGTGNEYFLPSTIRRLRSTDAGSEILCTDVIPPVPDECWIKLDMDVGEVRDTIDEALETRAETVNPLSHVGMPLPHPLGDLEEDPVDIPPEFKVEVARDTDTYTDADTDKEPAGDVGDDD